jgi:hypothetical protein
VVNVALRGIMLREKGELAPNVTPQYNLTNFMTKWSMPWTPSIWPMPRHI